MCCKHPHLNFVLQLLSIASMICELKYCHCNSHLAGEVLKFFNYFSDQISENNYDDFSIKHRMVIVEFWVKFYDTLLYLHQVSKLLHSQLWSCCNTCGAFFWFFFFSLLSFIVLHASFFWIKQIYKELKFSYLPIYNLLLFAGWLLIHFFNLFFF